MPKPKPALNAFPPALASEIVGMSVHMLNYLSRHRYLVPTYGRSLHRGKASRGKTRYYSYRDLVVARLIRSLLESGIEIKRLKEGIKKLSDHPSWSSGPEQAARMLATDGRDVYLLGEDGTILDVTKNGQFAFAFVLDVNAAQAEVKKNLKPEQLSNFSLSNQKIRYETAA